MSGTNLFSRLSAYSQNPHKLSIENFCTELLAHFFNQDPVFRRRFLKVIFSDQRMSRAFKGAAATTQESMGNDCRVDMVLRSGSRIHLIEVKITAGETLSGRWGQRGKPQIQRYVDLGCGHVTYLTTREVVSGNARIRMHQAWEIVRPDNGGATVPGLLGSPDQGCRSGRSAKRVTPSLFWICACTFSQGIRSRKRSRDHVAKAC